MKFLQSTNGKPLRTMLRASLEATRDCRGAFLLFIGIFIVAKVLSLTPTLILGEVINAFVRHGLTDTAFEFGIRGIAAYVGVRLLSTFLLHVGRYVQFSVAYQARMRTLEKVFGALLSLPLQWHTRNHSGESIAKLSRVQATINTFVETHLWQLIEGVVSLLVILAIIGNKLNLAIACLVVLGPIVPMTIMVLLNRKVVNVIRDRIGFDNKLSRITLDYLSNIVTVKTMGVEPAAQRYISRQKREGHIYAKRFAFLNEARWQTMDVGNAVIIGASLYLYLSLERHRGAEFNVGQIYVLISYLEQVLQTLWNFSSQYNAILESWTSYRDGEEILDEAEKQKQLALARKPDLVGTWREAKLENIFFRYGDGRAPALNHLSLTLRRGEKVAVIGPNGGGKSTLMKSLAGLLPVSIERIQLDGKEIDLQAFDDLLILIPQEPEIFNETFRYNLTLGDDYSDEELKAATDAAVLGGVIDRMPLGLDTNLMQKGLNLSGGEKQRIALARGILRANNRDILVLDEPTSSVDARTEKLIFENILAVANGKTVISTLHRLQLIPFFDRVVLIEQGQVVEDGTVVELLRKRGEFYKIWSDFVKKSSTMWGEHNGESEPVPAPTPAHPTPVVPPEPADTK